MTPFAVVVMAAGMCGALTGVMDANPGVFLPCRCERLPGESDLDYLKREMARRDALMRKVFANGDKDIARWEANARRAEETIKQATAYMVSREADINALQALGGGVADHPKFSYTRRYSPAHEERLRALFEEQEEAKKRLERSSVEVAEVLERSRQNRAKLEAILKRHKEEEAKRDKR